MLFENISQMSVIFAIPGQQHEAHVRHLKLKHFAFALHRVLQACPPFQSCM